MIPDCNSLDSVRQAHSLLEATALVFFALLVLFDVLAHLSKDENKKTLLEKIGLGFFAVAVLAEIIAYPYGQRNDALSARIIGSLDAKASEADHKSDSAISKSGAAETKANASDKKTDVIEKRLDSASIKMGKLEDDILAQGPRWLLLERGENVFIKALKPFRGQRVTVVTCGNGDPEREGLDGVPRVVRG